MEVRRDKVREAMRGAGVVAGQVIDTMRDGSYKRTEALQRFIDYRAEVGPTLTPPERQAVFSTMYLDRMRRLPDENEPGAVERWLQVAEEGRRAAEAVRYNRPIGKEEGVDDEG